MSTPHPDRSPCESGVFSIPVPVITFVQLFGWDGALPLFVALGPIVVKAIWPKPPLLIGTVLVLAPPVAALIRAHIGWHQIAKRCAGRAPWLRQIAMAIAILLLLAFEGGVCIMTFSDNIPASAWWFPIGFYTGYVAMITLALRPPRAISRPLDGTDARGQI
jgi:hypothetical protein